MKPKLIFYGGVGTATGANILLQSEAGKILIDCGLLQEVGQAEKSFEDFRYNPSEINFLLITHAHMDHLGRVPKLVRDGFRGRIISTPATKELALPMLQDALSVMKARNQGRSIFDEEDIAKSLLLWEGRDYGEEIKLFPEVSLKMVNAGHILGPSIIVVTLITPPTPLNLRGGSDQKITVAFTGDLGNSPSPLLPDTEIPQNVDHLVMESVYGDRNHESKSERREKLKQILLAGIERGGSIIIPAFSIERTQVLLYELNNLIENKEIPETAVFLDSPLAEKVTLIYKKYESYFKKSVKDEISAGDDIFDFPNFKIVSSSRESGAIEKIKGAKIILSGSGMSEGGRILGHEERLLDDPENTVLLVGYQSVGTLGRALEEGRSLVKIKGRKVRVRAKIEVMKGFSSHMDSDHLVDFVDKVNTPRPPLASRGGVGLKKVFCIMGEPKASLFLCQRLRDYVGVEAIYPEVGKEYELN